MQSGRSTPMTFHIIGDKLINPIVGVYIPIIRIPIKMTMAHMVFFCLYVSFVEVPAVDF